MRDPAATAPGAPRDWARGLLDALNPAQRRAAEAVQGPVCILAGAGTGKTRTITHRIANQVASGVARGDQILAVTFTDRAARELRQRLAGLGLPQPVRAATFHAAAWAQLRHFWPRLSQRPLPEVLPSKLRLLSGAAKQLGVEASDLAAEIEWAKARMLAPDQYAAAAGDRDAPLEPEGMAQVYAAYERDKDRADLIDYDDMLLRLHAVLRDDPQIAEQVRERYRFFTVDEFQDVNPAQHALLHGWLGDQRELCVVGDDDQTIYSFTGATSGYLTGFARSFPDARVVRLTDSYRSTAPVLDLADRIRGRGAARRKRLRSLIGDGPRPQVRACDDHDAEVTAVVDRIRELLADGVPAAQIAICYRTNSQSEPFEEALRAARIPFTVRGDVGFFQRPEVRQALSALARSSADPRSLDDPPPPEGTHAARPPRVERVAERVLRHHLRWHPRRPPAGAAARERWEHLGALMDLITQLAAEDAVGSMGDLMTKLSERAQTVDHPSPNGAVTLLTLHKAKGLEFDAVFLVSLEEGMLPISYARTPEEVAEERRLLYVGVTRARRHLWLSWAKTRVGRRGHVSRRQPSRFLTDAVPGVGPSPPPRRPCSCGAALRSGGERRNGRCARCEAAARDASDDPAVADARERLRAWRRQRAATDGVPAYVVFADRTLDELVTRCPRTLEELLCVHGFGPAKVDRYGQEVLTTLASARVRP